MNTQPYIRDADLDLYHGDALEVLRTLPAESVDCVLTSPPFYGLRDYGVEGQIGLEASPDEWVARLVVVFAEVRRVLRAAGTLWIECGDGYAQYDGQGNKDDPREPGMHGAFRMSSRLSATAEGRGDRHSLPTGFKRKDLLGTPWLLAFALRADGWYLRQAIIWAKPNAMPESVRDRCTTAHSYVFLLSKQPRYFFDADAIAEPAEWARWGDQTVPKYEGTETASGWMQPKTKAELERLSTNRRGFRGEGDGPSAYVNQSGPQHNHQANGGREVVRDPGSGRKNARSVWSIPTSGFAEAHFATWPPALVERILKAGCPEGGVCLDPFFGSGTTGLVARKLGRRTVGIELNADYCAMAARRLNQLSLLA